MRAALLSTPHDVLYINSLYSRRFSIEPLVMRRLGMLPPAAVVVAPRGELSVGALGLKSPKKRAFLAAARLMKLYDGVLWQATSTSEVDEIRAHFGAATPVHLAPNLTEAPVVEPSPTRSSQKRPGKLRLAFLSRITPMKNLLGGLELLDGLNGEVSLDVYGPVADVGYWRQCQARARTLSDNVRVAYRGHVPFGAAGGVLVGYDAFFLPTLGENFGHAIFEALMAGCPVLISDRTPWRDLATIGVGWDLPVTDRPAWRGALQACIDMTAEERGRMSAAARAYAVDVASDPSRDATHVELFARAATLANGRSPH
jgi:glycosyltransferase involved in cell wall biosynthesis